ncbi:MAG: BON domain-containing protein [Gemmataceae bacterium]
MRRLVSFTVLLTAAAGCQKSDTETLARLGRRLADRGQAALDDVRARLDVKWSPAEPSLEDRVRLRLRYDGDLGEAPVEIKVDGVQVEVSGKARSAEHKNRIVTLIETTKGVERVIDTIVVDSGPPPAVEPPKTPEPPPPPPSDPPEPKKEEP